MEIKLEKWFTNGDKTRYKIALGADNFVECPVKKILFSNGLQVVKDDSAPTSSRWSLTVFGEERVKWFAEMQIPVEALPWEKNTISIANGIKRADTPYMKKAELISVLESLMEREVKYMGRNVMIKPEYRNLKLKK